MTICSVWPRTHLSWLPTFQYANIQILRNLLYTIILHTIRNVYHLSEGCSPRSPLLNGAKSRNRTPTLDLASMRQNCSERFVYYCLNEGICFTQDFMADDQVFCRCPRGWKGRRCEYEETSLDRYLPPTGRARQLETAAISVAVTLLVVALICLILTLFVYKKKKNLKVAETYIFESVDGLGPDRPFSIQHKRPIRTDKSDTQDIDTAKFRLIDGKTGRPFMIRRPDPGRGGKAPLARPEEQRIKDSFAAAERSLIPPLRPKAKDAAASLIITDSNNPHSSVKNDNG